MLANPSKVHKNNHDEHYTPIDLLDLTMHSLGSIDLDAATCQKAIDLLPDRLKPPKFYTAENPAPTVWEQRNIWCNPPFSKIQYFIDAAVRSARENASSTMFLMPPNMSTKYIQNIFRDLAEQELCSPIMFHYGRVYFWDGVKNEKGKNPPGSTCMFIIAEMGDNATTQKVDRFIQKGKNMGHLFMEVV